MRLARLRLTPSVIGNALAVLALSALAVWMLRLQPAPWPALTAAQPARWLATAALALWLLLCAWAVRSRTPRSRAVDTGSPSDWLVVHASQTGLGLEVAQRTADTLRDAGCTAEMRDIATLEAAALRGRRCLFVASTTGEGDPPDAALDFAGTAMETAIDLHDTAHAVLALGDRTYAQFCAFGHRLDGWLRACGAERLFETIEVDNADPGALHHWQRQIGMLAGRQGIPDWRPPDYRPWVLAERRVLNPGSAGGPVVHLELSPPDSEALRWQAGDIAEIQPRNAPQAVANALSVRRLQGTTLVDVQGHREPLADVLARSCLADTDIPLDLDADALARRLKPLPRREYSIASIPAEGRLQLLVRLVRDARGEPGLGSGWLCMHAPLGGTIDLRIRSNPNFHAPDTTRPLVLIGNGTGLAGLRAHLKARIAAGAHRNWLLFGERNAFHDRLYGDELDTWLREGGIARIDRVFSRDGNADRYVQDALRAQAATLLAWLEEGAAVYVCGSQRGMAPGVDAALEELLGAEALRSLARSGRYRRDIY